MSTAQITSILVAIARMEERLIDVQADVQKLEKQEQRITSLETSMSKIKWAFAGAWAIMISLIGTAINKLWPFS
jgi:hypothetical protein